MKETLQSCTPPPGGFSGKRPLPSRLLPQIRDAFQFLHPLGLRDGATKSREQMNMIFHAANEEGRAIELFGDAAEIRMESRLAGDGFVAQKRPTVLGGEDQMNVNRGKKR